jgi:hypothetical protein
LTTGGLDRRYCNKVFFMLVREINISPSDFPEFRSVFHVRHFDTLSFIPHYFLGEASLGLVLLSH